MKVLLQRVKWAKVSVNSEVVGRIAMGLCLFVGVSQEDTLKEAKDLAERISKMRVFNDENGKLNLSLKDVGGEVLAVSQFTLCADCSRGLRPSFVQAMPPEPANEIYLEFVKALRACEVRVETGVFQADMDVELCNWGPVTLMIEKRSLSEKKEG